MPKMNYAAARGSQARSWLSAAAGIALGITATSAANAQDTIKIGILHSLS